MAGPVSVVWAVLDTVVDDYAPVVQGLTEDVEDAEVRVFEGGGDQTERIYLLKREAIEFHRAVHPLLAPLAAIERGVDPRVTGALQNYFRDINDHVKLVHDEIGSQRELLTSILQANLAVLGARQNEISVQQNETSKQLTLIATIFLPLTFITGFFGMNFPWLVDHIGSFWSLRRLWRRQPADLLRGALRLVPAQPLSLSLPRLAVRPAPGGPRARGSFR